MLALVLLFALFGFFLVLIPVVTSVLSKVIDSPQALMRIAMVVQDIFVFTVPAIVVALVATRLPARLLGVEVAPSAPQLLLSILALLCSIPAMNLIVEWNEGWHLPSSLSSVETAMRQLEDNAKNATDMLMEGASVGSLIVSILIVGVFAGFSEEIFFRGALQRIMQATRINGHVAVWTAALIFSVLHFQMFGFVPRLLLGAFFGYVLWWTNSLWIPIAVHALNNSLVVVSTWHSANNPDSTFAALENIGSLESSEGSLWIVLLSIALTAVCLRLLYLYSIKNHNKQ